MITRTIVKPIYWKSRVDEFRLLIEPDNHEGNEACDEVLQAEFIKDALQPNTYWVGVGDMCEFIDRRDKRFDPQALAPWLLKDCEARAEAVSDPGVRARPLTFLAQAQRDRYIAKHKPIADRCLALLKGNHEDTMERFNETPVYGPICEAMGATAERPLALGMCGFLRLAFRRQTGKTACTWDYDIYMTHGWWNGELIGNGALNLERIFGWALCDAVVAGHDHKGKLFPLARIEPMANGETRTKDGFCIGAGALMTKATYVEQKRPLVKRWVTMTFRPDKQEVHVSM